VPLGRISVHSPVYRFDSTEAGTGFPMDVLELPMIVAAGWVAILGLVVAVLLVANDADDAEELGLPAGFDIGERLGA
jgi:hypothetical protein